MGVYKVPIFGTVGKTIRIETGDELTQAQVVALINQAFATYSPNFVQVSANPTDTSTPLWSRIQDVPQNIVDVAALASSGVLFRNAVGHIVTIPIPIAPPGEEGPPGEDGSPGPQGPQGPTGPTGPPGPSGSGSGSAGPPGQDGIDGEDGISIPGVPGPAGATGPAGAAGVAGYGKPGEDGQDGDDGPMGPPGLSGAKGATGATGAAGSAGSTGAPGQDGDDGSDQYILIAPPSAGFNTAANYVLTGAWTFDAPTGASAIIAQGVDSQYAVGIFGSATSGKSFGLAIEAGTTSADQAITVLNQAGSTVLFNVIGAPTATTGVLIKGFGTTAGALVDMTPDHGTYTATGTGFSGTAPSSTAVWTKMGAHVTVTITAIQGTSNATSFTITGMPAIIQPARTQYLACPSDFFDTSSSLLVNTVAASISTAGVITLYLGGNSSGWVNTGTKGLFTGFGWTFSFELL